MSYNINTANYGHPTSPFPSGLRDATGAPGPYSSNILITSVGTNGSPSFFGTYDQTGGVSEHIEKKVLFSANDTFKPIVTPTGSEIFIPANRQVSDAPIERQFNFASGVPVGPPPPPPQPIRPPTVTPVFIPPSQNFGYGNSNRGGSYVSSSGDINKESPLQYSVPNSPSDSVGFRLAAASRVFNLTGVLMTSGNTTVNIPSGQISLGEITVAPGMDIKNSTLFKDNTKVQTLSTSYTTISGVAYNRVVVDAAPIAGGTGLSITVSDDNTLNLKNMVLIDSSGNNPDGFSPGYGRVNYNYYIGKYVVTNSEYCAYLNEVAKYANDSEVYYTPASNRKQLNMSHGIVREATGRTYSGKVIEYKYIPVVNQDNKPVVGITWLQAARYSNWLHNRCTSTDTTNTNKGAYDLSNPLQTLTRTDFARYFIPNENEWYKAAYYGKEGGVNVYRKHATRTNVLPSRIAYIDRYSNGPYINLTDVSLFDRHSFDILNDQYWIGILNEAADRWDKHLSLVEFHKVTDTDAHDGYRYEVKDKSRYEACKLQYESSVNFRTSWKGLKLEKAAFGHSIKARDVDQECRQFATIDSLRIPTSFNLFINRRYGYRSTANPTYSRADWVNVFTRALGQALGFGSTSWSRDNNVVSNYFLDQAFYSKTSIEYNRVAHGVTGGYTRKYIPIEQTSGVTSTNNFNDVPSFWEDNYLTDGECFTPLNCSVDTPYVGIKDIMNTTYRKNSILSNVTVANLVDIGYYSKDNTITGEGDFQPIYSGIDPNSA